VASGTALQRAGRRMKIEIADQDGPRLLWIIAANKWPTTYLGKNVFLLTEEQVARVKAEGITPLKAALENDN
jgi:hypothetical protein